jgi:hypothetical protein
LKEEKPVIVVHVLKNECEQALRQSRKRQLREGDNDDHSMVQSTKKARLQEVEPLLMTSEALGPTQSNAKEDDAFSTDQAFCAKVLEKVKSTSELGITLPRLKVLRFMSSQTITY